VGSFALVIFLFLLSVSLFVLTDIWVGVWANKKLTPKRLYLDTYIFFAIAAAIFVIIRDMTVRLR